MLQQRDPVEPRPAVPHYEVTYTPAPPPAEEGFDIRAVLAVLFRRRWLILITFLAVFSLGMAYTLSQRPIYESTASIIVNSNNVLGAEDIGVLKDLQTVTENRSIETQVAVLSSSALLQEAYAKLDQDTQRRGFRSTSVPGWAVRVSGKHNTDVIDITVEAYTAAAAAAFANSIAQTYFTRDLADVREATQQALRYLEDKRNGLNDQLVDVNKRLAALKAQTGMLNPEASLTETAQRLSSLQADLDDARTQMSISEQTLASLRTQLSHEEQTVISGTTVTGNPRYTAALASIDALQQERTRMLQEYTPTSPEVQAINGRIADETRALGSISTTIVANESHAQNPLHEATMRDYAVALGAQTAAAARARRLEATLNEWRERAKGMPERERQFVELTQLQTQLKGTYDLITTKVHNLLLGERILPNGHVVSVADVPAQPVRPRKTTDTVVFLLLSLVIVGVLVRLIELVDDRVHDDKSAEVLTGLPAVGIIGEIPGNAAPLLSAAHPHPPLLEQFRVLRNNLSLTDAAQHRKVLAVTSFAKSEGKSVVSANLAIAMALDGKRALLLDGDLYRQPTVSVGKDVQGAGLTEILRGEITLDAALQPTDVAGLSFLPSGKFPTHPVELLNSPEASSLLRELADRFDIIILDCPPCTKFSDVQVIAKHADGMLVVVANEKTPRRGLRMAVDNLRFLGAPLVGLVINRVKSQHQGYNYQDYYDAYVPAEDAALTTADLKALGNRD